MKIDGEDVRVNIMPQMAARRKYLEDLLELYNYIKPVFNYKLAEEAIWYLTQNLNNILIIISILLR